jgi:signal transduction histidine kinase
MPVRRSRRYGRLVQLRPLLVDLLVVLAAVALSTALLAASGRFDPGVREPDVAGYALILGYSGSVLARRRTPGVAVLVGLAAGLVYAAAQYPPVLTPVVLLSVYTAAGAMRGRRAHGLLAVAVLLGFVTATLSPGPTDTGVPTLTVAAWLLGKYVGSKRDYTSELERKNQLLEQAQRDLADRAVTEERLRIARELHDVVAHTMSVVAVHAGTGRMVADDDPGAARQALATIETASRSALVEMRRLLGVLRAPDGGQQGTLDPAPGLRDLDALVADVVKSGVTVDVRVEGHRPEVPPGIDLTAYRIVQEALTNVIKHAGRARTAVVVCYADDAMTVEVTDDGGDRRTRPTARPDGHGHGLRGMAERVAAYDGELDTGARPEGGFRVRARLPLGGQV